MKIFVKNFGCKTNFADLFSLLGAISNYVELEISDFSDAEVVILNSCSVTQDSEREIIKWVRKSKRNGKKVLVSGCMPNINSHDILEAGADSIIGAGKYTAENVIRSILPIMRAKSIKTINYKTQKGDDFNGIFNTEDRFEKEEINNKGEINNNRNEKQKKSFLQNIGFQILRNPKDVSSEIEDDVEYFSRCLHLFPRHRIYLKIQEGCSRFCSFCSIPLTRGIPRSLKPEKVLEKMSEFAEKGFREIVIVGTHLALYGKDINFSFGKLVKSIAKNLKDLEGAIRIRFASLSPGEIDDDFLEGIEYSKKLFCPHFHISVQSGSNRILKLMKRWHTFEDFLSDSEKLLKIYPDACIGTDIIVGFPGETDDDFEITFHNIKNAPLGHIHVFPFSPRPKTPASLMRPIPDKILKERLETMLALAFEKRKNFFEKSVSKKFTLLVENLNGVLSGTTENYINCVVKGYNSVNAKEGDFLPVIIKRLEVDGKRRKILASCEPAN